MSSSNLVRVDAVAAVAAGVLLLVADVWGLVQEFALGGSEQAFSEIAATATWTVASAMFLIGALLLLVASVGLHARQLEAAGVLGLAGFLTALVGTGLLVGISWALAFVVPSAAIEAPAFLNNEETAGPLYLGFMLSAIAAGLGWALFGMSMLRARVYPRAAAILLIVGALVAIVPLPATTALVDVALIWLGVSALREKERKHSADLVGAEA